MNAENSTPQVNPVVDENFGRCIKRSGLRLRLREQRDGDGSSKSGSNPNLQIRVKDIPDHSVELVARFVLACGLLALLLQFLQFGSIGPAVLILTSVAGAVTIALDLQTAWRSGQESRDKVVVLTPGSENHHAIQARARFLLSRSYVGQRVGVVIESYHDYKPSRLEKVLMLFFDEAEPSSIIAHRRRLSIPITRTQDSEGEAVFDFEIPLHLIPEPSVPYPFQWRVELRKLRIYS